MKMQRRALLTAIAGSTFVIAGCAGDENETITETPTPEGVVPYPPESNDTWVFTGTSEYDWSPLGVEDGVVGLYTRPDSETFDLVVMGSAIRPMGDGQSLACAGWQMVLVLEDRDVTIAASTGTPEQTLTPEAPPTMTETPTEGSEDRVRELLVRSPHVDDVDIAEHRVQCPER